MECYWQDCNNVAVRVIDSSPVCLEHYEEEI